MMNPKNTGSGKAAKVRDLKVGPAARAESHRGGSGAAAKNDKANASGSVAHRLSATRKGSGQGATVKE
jgi:hypothetical protein